MNTLYKLAELIEHNGFLVFGVNSEQLVDYVGMEGGE